MVHVCARFQYVDDLFIALWGNMQSTYVIFGAADIEKSDPGGGSHHATARRAGAEAFLKPAPANCAPRELDVRKV